MTSPSHPQKRLFPAGASPKQNHHPNLERGALTLFAIAAISAIWLGIGLPAMHLTPGEASIGNSPPFVVQLSDQLATAAPVRPYTVVYAPRGGRVSRVSDRVARRTTDRPVTLRTGTIEPRASVAVASTPTVASAAAPAVPAVTTTFDTVQPVVNDGPSVVAASTSTLPTTSDVEGLLPPAVTDVVSTVTSSLPPALPPVPIALKP